MHMLRPLTFCCLEDPHRTPRTMWVAQYPTMHCTPLREQMCITWKIYIKIKIYLTFHLVTMKPLRYCTVDWWIKIKLSALVPGGWHLFTCGCSLQQPHPGKNPAEFTVLCDRKKPGTACHWPTWYTHTLMYTLIHSNTELNKQQCWSHYKWLYCIVLHQILWQIINLFTHLWPAKYTSATTCPHWCVCFFCREGTQLSMWLLLWIIRRQFSSYWRQGLMGKSETMWVPFLQVKHRRILILISANIKSLSVYLSLYIRHGNKQCSEQYHYE